MSGLQIVKTRKVDSRRVLCLGLLLASLGVSGCDRAPRHDNLEKADPTPTPKDLPAPPFSVTPKMTNGLFTWVDKDGSFQIADRPDAVPEHARKLVRVVVEAQSPGSPEHVYVVDLSGLASGGALPVRALPRTEWERQGKKERDARVEKLIPEEKPAQPSPADLGVDAIVYGADWCKPCHMAEDYLKKKGARVVKKDIEEDPQAATEMRAKLKAAGMSGSSIPVLDVGGTILRGFSEGSIDAALTRSAK